MSERDCLLEHEALARATAISEVSYELSLDLRKASTSFVGRVVVRFTHHAPGEGTFLDHHGGEVLGITVNGVKADGLLAGYRIRLPSELLRRRNEIVIEYQNPFDRTGVGFHRFVDPEDSEVYLFTDFEPFSAHRLFPCFDQPDLKATYAIDVTAPKTWTVISNGAVVHEEALDAERSRRRFAVLPRFSPYLVAVVAGPYVAEFDRTTGVPLGVYCRKSLRRHLDPGEIFEITKQGFAWYEKTFGAPYAFGKYDQVFVPEFNSGAMENVACVTFNEAQVFRDPPTEVQRLHRAEVILHELAHMWFGNLVTMRWWDGLWLNESFATYIAFLAMAEATRFSGAWQDFLGTIKAWAYREDQKPTTHPIAGSVDDTEQTFLNFDGITYGKGAAVLKQLRAVIGGVAFDAGLRLYFARHAFGNTTLDDFLRALGDAAHRDLGGFSASWLSTSGVNTLRPVAGAKGELLLAQDRGNGDGRLRAHTLEIGRFARNAAGRLALAERAAFTVEGERTRLGDFTPPAPGELVFANLADHAYAKVHLDPTSLATAVASLASLDDPLARLGIWSTLFDMTRDGDLAPEAFLDLVVRHGLADPDLPISEAVLRNASTALSRYLAPSAAPAVAARLIAASERALASHPAGLDGRRTLARALPGFASSVDQARAFVAWLDGRAPDGVEVDQGLRWRILTRASAFGLDGTAERLDQESRRDPSDRGRKALFGSKAAAPDPATKREVFDRFRHPGEMSADLAKSAMPAFFWPHQAALLSPFALEYCRSLPEVLAKEDLEYVARGFVRLLFPHAVASEEVLALAESVLAGLSAKDALLRRFLLEETDEMRRTLRLRAKTGGLS